MNLTVYIPKGIEAKLKSAAQEAQLSPARFVQRLIKRELEGDKEAFSADFAALSGSWEDSRSAAEIIDEIERSRLDTDRQELV